MTTCVYILCIYIYIELSIRQGGLSFPGSSSGARNIRILIAWGLHPRRLEIKTVMVHRAQYHPQPCSPYPKIRTKQGFTKGYAELVEPYSYSWVGVIGSGYTLHFPGSTARPPITRLPFFLRDWRAPGGKFTRLGLGALEKTTFMGLTIKKALRPIKLKNSFSNQPLIRG